MSAKPGGGFAQVVLLKDLVLWPFGRVFLSPCYLFGLLLGLVCVPCVCLRHIQVLLLWVCFGALLSFVCGCSFELGFWIDTT